MAIIKMHRAIDPEYNMRFMIHSPWVPETRWIPLRSSLTNIFDSLLLNKARSRLFSTRSSVAVWDVRLWRRCNQRDSGIGIEVEKGGSQIGLHHGGLREG